MAKNVHDGQPDCPMCALHRGYYVWAGQTPPRCPGPGIAYSWMEIPSDDDLPEPDVVIGGAGSLTGYSSLLPAVTLDAATVPLTYENLLKMRAQFAEIKILLGDDADG